MNNGVIQVEACGRTDTGRKRSNNQDSMLVADLSVVDGYSIDGDASAASQPGHFPLGEYGALLLVADGMGGAAAGDVASRLAVAHIRDQFAWGANGAQAPDAQAFTDRLRESLETANAKIHAEALRDSRYYGMGTTATMAGLLAGNAYFAQVGDSRAYLIRDAVAVQVTRDQSLVQELVDAGNMTEEEAERSEHSNKILQALGAAPSVGVVLTHHPMRRGDTILLCSDGLTRVVRKEEIGEASLHASNTATLCQGLIDLGNSRGGPDNITVVAARLAGDGLDQAAPGDIVTRMNYKR